MLKDPCAAAYNFYCMASFCVNRQLRVVIVVPKPLIRPSITTKTSIFSSSIPPSESPQKRERLEILCGEMGCGDSKQDEKAVVAGGADDGGSSPDGTPWYIAVTPGGEVRFWLLALYKSHYSK